MKRFLKILKWALIIVVAAVVLFYFYLFVTAQSDGLLKGHTDPPASIVKDVRRGILYDDGECYTDDRNFSEEKEKEYETFYRDPII